MTIELAALTAEHVDLLAEHADLLDLLRAVRDALERGVPARAVRSAIDLVLQREVGQVEATMTLRRLAAKRGRRST